MPPTLDTLAAGESARVVKLGGERAFRRRLMELGLLPGTIVRVVRRADVGGVLEIEVRGCRVTVRRRDAGSLEVIPA
jgi:Fe2+ transport system protein FeoA